MIKQKSGSRVVIIITFILIIEKTLGFLREVLLAYEYGTSYIVDSYLMAESIAATLLGVLFYACSPFTPVYSELIAHKEEEEAQTYLNTLLTYVFLIGFIISIAIVLFSDRIVFLFAPGFNNESHYETVIFLQCGVWHRIFAALAGLFSAYLNYNSKYIISKSAYITVSIINIGIVLLSKIFGYQMLRFSLTSSYGTLFLIIFIFSLKTGFRFKPSFKISKALIQTGKMIIPVAVCNMATYLNAVVDKNFASSLPVGSVSAINYAWTIYESVFLIFSSAIETMSYPNISKSVAVCDSRKTCDIVEESISILLLIFIPITFGGFILSNNITVAIFGRGAFGSESTEMVAIAFSMYSLAFSSKSINTILGNVVYAHKRTLEISIINTFSIVLNFLLNYKLISTMGHEGLALASSIVSWLVVPAYIVLAKKFEPGINYSKIANVAFRSLVASIIMALCISVINNRMFLDINNIVKLVAIVFIGIVIYFLLLIFFKVKLIKEILYSFVKNRS